jgi:hypothetical protein
MSPGSGSELCRSEHLIHQYCGCETGSRAHCACAGSERYCSGSEYINTSV